MGGQISSQGLADLMEFYSYLPGRQVGLTNPKRKANTLYWILQNEPIKTVTCFYGNAIHLNATVVWVTFESHHLLHHTHLPKIDFAVGGIFTRRINEHEQSSTLELLLGSKATKYSWIYKHLDSIHSLYTTTMHLNQWKWSTQDVIEV